MIGKRETSFKTLLEGYNRPVASDPNLVSLASRLIKDFKVKRRRALKLQATKANDFNLLETLQIWQDEIKHSLMLAWLLDRDATHAQGNLGFEIFLKHFGFSRDYAKTEYRVVKERHGPESRIDLEVAAAGKFIIHIENKIFSIEGKKQTEREGKDLLHQARLLKVHAKNIHGLYLTLDGHRPECAQFRAISWKEIANVVDDFAVSAKAKKIRLFATHYAQALRKMTFILPDHDENKD